jgi:hypothetical protein
MKNKTNLYKAINIMSSVKFSVNKQLFDYLKNEGKYLLDHIDETSQIFNDNEFKKYESEELQRITTLQIAETYLNTNFYLPLQSD